MMKKFLIVLCAVLAVCVVVLYIAVEETKDPGPPPDLNGRWVQTGINDETAWYFFADISDDLIEVWWYLPEYDEVALYWSGTFTPPVNGKLPYSWTSVNDLEKARTSQRASREAQKTYTYKDGRINYIVTAGHLQMGYALERAPADFDWGENARPMTQEHTDELLKHSN